MSSTLFNFVMGMVFGDTTIVEPLNMPEAVTIGKMKYADDTILCSNDIHSLQGSRASFEESAALFGLSLYAKKSGLLSMNGNKTKEVFLHDEKALTAVKKSGRLPFYLDLSIGFNITYDDLHLSKRSTRWVPCRLTEEHKTNHLKTACHFKEQYLIMEELFWIAWSPWTKESWFL
ncbi:unnamed protein product [Lepeophtheirus salmonis]|uniref:(salmon louse) hypothetical protein n=1 Tax=Lepeophtheirus salmonis TaxID=72036 RepID=A0A7R8H4H8_LEPSM|nr:unnamed protein product [Lepeophtheirus salmonis]CAF2862662.1 unnamed protein product [Lepeophtheirus salmonis]